MVPADHDTTILARVGHALSDPTRCHILVQLFDAPAYPADLAEVLGVSRTKLSNHLKCLRDCGLVTTEAIGRRSLYRIADPRLENAIAGLLSISFDPTTHCDQMPECSENP